LEKDSFEDFKRELKQKNDLVSVASKYVALERKGRYYWCRCPFHGEKTPSLCINDIDGMFYCYGCHVGGDVIKFVMQIESQSFIEAIKTLAGWANMEVPESFDGTGNNGNIALAKKRKDRLISLMKDAAMHYHENLDKQNAKSAREYLEKRQLSSSLIKRFGIGYADGYNELPDFLRAKGYTNEEMLAVGVVKQKDGRVYDPLASRVIFPIIDIYGNVIAFGGRTLEAHPNFAKYLNTAETELFNKRNTLYAINYLKKQRQLGPIPFVIVVEGYMDTISLHKAGFTMAVASMGTALTQSQAKMIKRFADKVYICYDGDSAGQNATLRGLDILKENGLDVMVVQLPDKFDPDDVIKTYGKEGYQKILDDALPLVEFKLKYLKTKYDLSSVDGRVKYLNDAIEILSELSSPVERELYTPMVSEIAQTNNDFIKREVDKKMSGKPILNEIQSGFLKAPTRQIKDDDSESENANPVVVKAEKYVLCSLIHKKPYAYFKTDITYLFSGKRREIYRLICDSIAHNPSVNLVQELYNDYENDNQSTIVDIINYNAESAEDEQNEKKYYYDCVWVIYKNYLETKLKELTDEYSGEIDIIKRKELSEKMKDITLKLKSKKVEEL
jgi:DNA primase